MSQFYFSITLLFFHSIIHTFILYNVLARVLYNYSKHLQMQLRTAVLLHFILNYIFLPFL